MQAHNSSRVVITGMGVITPLGLTPVELWSSLLESRTAACNWQDLEDEGFRITRACRVSAFKSEPLSRGCAMAIAAARAAVNDSGGTLDSRVGVFVGTTMGESARFEYAAQTKTIVNLKFASAEVYPRAILQALNVNGLAYAYGTACAAGNYAIGAAARLIKRGKIDVAIAGGVDAFSRIAMVGFSRSRAMSPDYCRPFDSERQGMQLGEASAFLMLEREDRALKRGARIYAAINALGLASDAYHATAPRPDGSGMATAMRSALARSGVCADAVDFICAHGSGTRASDDAEAQAISEIFPNRPVVAAYKGALGHSLGASTAVEAVITALALNNLIIPPTVNTVAVDSAMPIDVAIGQPRVMTQLRFALNCGYAFGGMNSALLMEAA